jgi:hypothetical protein
MFTFDYNVEIKDNRDEIEDREIMWRYIAEIEQREDWVYNSIANLSTDGLYYGGVIW